MKKTVVRLKSIKLEHFKNVEHGDIDLESPNGIGRASILGVYGQNGSGKTALIDALSLLRLALSGRSLPKSAADFINVTAAFARLTFAFTINSLQAAQEPDTVIYEFSIRRDTEDTQQNVDRLDEADSGCKAVLFDETLSLSCAVRGGKKRMRTVIDTRSGKVFSPQTEYELLAGTDENAELELMVAKRMTSADSRSFIFSKEFLTLIRKNHTSEERMRLINRIVNYGNFELFIIDTKNSALISLDALPLAFKYTEGLHRTLGNIMLPLNGTATIPQDQVKVAKKVIDCMNVVLTQLVPDLTISILELGAHVMKSGAAGQQIQLMSNRHGKELPLQYESEGIKKIISVLQILTVVYNDPSITVAIDELDAGIFEYLLGELLRIIGDKGQGQLIFTSHDLRPLETLDRRFIAFTTANPSNRYIRLKNVKKNNNLRALYYRDIMLGEQRELLYEPTNNYEISLAFREAGELIGS